MEACTGCSICRLVCPQRGNGRLWRRLARAPTVVAGRPVDRPLPESVEPARATRRALRRRRGKLGATDPVGALPNGDFDHAALRSTSCGWCTLA
eukprot:scaffold79296_cov32-Phaeocystis_antarctica.AAC.1